MATMKPKPFERLLDEAREAGIDPFEQGEFGPDNEVEIAKLKDKIKGVTEEPDLPTADDVLKKLQESEEPVLVRVVEWKEWLPASLTTLMSAEEQVVEHGQPKAKDKKMPLHNGVTGFISGKNEKLVDLSVEATGLTKVIEEVDEEGGESRALIYGCYVFQAVLVQNTRAAALEALLKAQEPPEVEVNDKASALTIVERGQQTQHKPNRKARRAANKKK